MELGRAYTKANCEKSASFSLSSTQAIGSIVNFCTDYFPGYNEKSILLAINATDTN